MRESELRFTRRNFLRLGLLGAGATMLPLGLSLGACAGPGKRSATGLAKEVSSGAGSLLPVRELSDLSDSGAFSGDEFLAPHQALWDKAGFIAARGGYAGLPVEKVPLVIVGGGISGLTAAYELRALGPVVLEQASRLGGNSKAESWEGLPFSLGTAYITPPEKGARSSALLEELGLLGRLRIDEGADELVLGPAGKLEKGFWAGATDPSRASEFARAARVFREVWENAYPDIPAGKESAVDASELARLDRLSFRQWLDRKLPKAHPHVNEFLEQYSWSSSGGGTHELSAAQALNFVTADLGGIALFPGGNSAIAQALAERLLAALPPSGLRVRSLVLDVMPDPEGVRVTYVDASSSVRQILARACIVSAPKLVARRLLDRASEADAALGAQLQAMARLRYRAYVVTNVLLSKPVRSPSAELMVLRGRAPRAGERRPFTDLIFAAWAGGDRAERSALTFYRCMPYAEARRELLGEGAHARIHSEFENALPPILQALGIPRAEVAAIRHARWGHAIPLGEPGLIASGTLERAARPIGGRIFFAEQDNWANPCFESAAGAAFRAADAVRGALA